MDLRQKVLSGLGWSAGARFLSQLITWSITIIIMRLLSPGDYGLMGMAWVFINFLTLLNELGLGAALIQKQEIEKTTLRQAFGILLLINFCLLLVVLLTAPLIGSFFQEQRVVPIIRLLSLQFLLMPLTIIPQSLLTRDMNFKKISIIEFISAISGSLCTLVLVMYGCGVWSLVWGSICLMLIRTSVLNITFPCLQLPIFSLKNMKGFFSFGGYVTAERILWFAYMRADSLLIGKFLGVLPLGYYSVATQLASLPMDKVSGIINQIAFPAYSAIQCDLEKVGACFLKSVRLMSFIAFPVLWGISCVAPELIALFLGNKWSAASLPLQLLTLVIPVIMVSNLMAPALLGLGRPEISFSFVFLRFLVMPMAIFVGLHWGITGVCLAWVVAFPLLFVFNMSRMVAILKIRPRDISTGMAKPFLCASIMYIGIMVIKILLKESGYDLGQLIILILGGVVIYCVATFVFCREGFRELVGLIQ